MASRRSRIKGIANIPQRRKPTIDATPTTVKDENDVSSADLEIGLVTDNEANLQPKAGEKATVKENENQEQNKENEEKTETANVEDQAAKESNGPDVEKVVKPPQRTFNRRRIIKPTISIKAINNNKSVQNDIKPENPLEIEIALKTTEESNNNQSQAEISQQEEEVKVFGTDNKSNINVIGITILPSAQNADNTNNIVSNIELARPPLPPSPSKFLNRQRIKAVPRLGQRRPSFSVGSASESEDESKKSLRIRHDSLCSTTTTLATESQTVVKNSPRAKKTEFNTVIQRKCKRTEQSRKLAEARRDFQMKFNNGKPDRQKLTMIDLIFYNPTSSPMSQKRKRKDTDTESILSQQNEVEAAEDEDDTPVVPEQEIEPELEKSDEENTIPAPQITIGANGEIVIDEKSLFIENKDVKRDRETLKKSTIVDGDNFDTGYGIYKRVKRSKDWSKPETLRFYKALNTLGTDFTLMGELFPERSRRELKMKFKKEERVNRSLIDRAVMQPIQFDLSDLQNDLEMQELEKKRQQQLKKDRQVVVKQDRKVKEKPDLDGEFVAKRRRRPRKIEAPEVEKPTLRKRLNQGINSLLESDSDSDNHDNNDDKPSESLTATIAVEAETEEIEEIQVQEEKHEQEEEEEQEHHENLTQGSIILSSNMNEAGDEIYSVCTVDENGVKIPMEITAEILEVLIRNQNGDNEEPDDSLVLPSDSTIDNILGDISISNIQDQTISDLSMTTDCLILPFEDDEMLGDGDNPPNIASVIQIGP